MIATFEKLEVPAQRFFNHYSSYAHDWMMPWSLDIPLIVSGSDRSLLLITTKDESTLRVSTGLLWMTVEHDSAMPDIKQTITNFLTNDAFPSLTDVGLPNGILRPLGVIKTFPVQVDGKIGLKSLLPYEVQIGHSSKSKLLELGQDITDYGSFADWHDFHSAIHALSQQHSELPDVQVAQETSEMVSMLVLKQMGVGY